MIYCPKCSVLSNETLELAGIALDRCPACGGIWLDAGELEPLLQSLNGETPTDLSLINPRVTALECPDCRKELWRGGLINPLLLVDKCLHCGGIWLDAGELNLAKRLLGLTGIEPPRPPSGTPKKRPEIFTDRTITTSSPIPPVTIKPQAAETPFPGRKSPKAAENNTGYAFQPLPRQADNELPSMFQNKAIPLFSAIAGFIGIAYQINRYIHRVDTVPFQSAPGLDGILQSMAWFFVVTIACTALFLYGFVTLILRLMEITGNTQGD